MEDAARTAYLFRCQGEDLYAVSHDKTGSNIPRSPCTQDWYFCEEFQLSRRAPVLDQSWPNLFSGGSWITATMCGGDGAAIPSVPPDECIQTIVKPGRSEPGLSPVMPSMQATESELPPCNSQKRSSRRSSTASSIQLSCGSNNRPFTSCSRPPVLGKQCTRSKCSIK